MLVMVSATVFFGMAAIFGHAGWKTGDVTTGPFALTAVGFCLLAVGGRLGGSIVFVHGMRVLGLADAPPGRRRARGPPGERSPEKEEEAAA
jgi:hypothetical protein